MVTTGNYMEVTKQVCVCDSVRYVLFDIVEYRVSVQGWAPHSVKNFQGPLHARTSHSLAARCSQSCRARDAAWRDGLGFSRLQPGGILWPRTCPVRPAGRPPLIIVRRHTAMDLREAQGQELGQYDGQKWQEDDGVALLPAACKAAAKK